MIRADASRCPISAQCRMPGVPRSACYWMIEHPEAGRVDPIAGDVRAVRRDGRERHDARKIKAALERKGVTASRRRIGDIMREQGMTGAYARGRSEPHRTRADEAGLANLPDPRVRRLRPAHASGGRPDVCEGRERMGVRVSAGRPGGQGHRRPFRRTDPGRKPGIGRVRHPRLPAGGRPENRVCRPEGSAGPSSRILTLGDNSMQADRVRETERINDAFLEEVVPFAVHGATIVDARGMTKNGWLVSDGRSIVETGCAETDFETDFETACRLVHVEQDHIVNANGMVMTPGYVDIHSHGAWGSSFDDGEKGITARAGHMAHGTTRQVLSLITNPIDVICGNLKTVHDMMPDRPDILGAHLEGPFLAMSRKGAHDPNCLVDPTPDLVSRMLDAADGCLRQITIAPELPHGIDAIRRFFLAGVVPAVGHCDADYQTARKGFDAGAGIMTHMFNAMNGLHHRDPGPIPAWRIRGSPSSLSTTDSTCRIPWSSSDSGLRPIESPSSPTPWPRPTVRTGITSSGLWM